MIVENRVLKHVDEKDLWTLIFKPHEFWKDIEIIGKKAFSKLNLQYIYIPDGIVRIEERAFYACKNLKVAILPDSVKNVESFAFGMCLSFRC